MERDDEQLLRHSTRELARFLSIFYDELRAAGIPRRLAERLTYGQWQQLQLNGQMDQITQALEALRSEGEDD